MAVFLLVLVMAAAVVIGVGAFIRMIGQLGDFLDDMQFRPRMGDGEGNMTGTTKTVEYAP